MAFKDRSCEKRDYKFVFEITTKTLKPLIQNYVKWSDDFFKKSFEKDYQKMKIVTVNKKRVGFYQLEEKGNNLYITKIFIHPDYQGKGIGRELMNHFEKLGFKKVELEVWDNNPAISFYKKLGYKVTETKDHKLFMEKEIK